MKCFHQNNKKQFCQYIYIYYISLFHMFTYSVGENSVQKEQEFIQKCMTVLREAVTTIEKV